MRERKKEARILSEKRHQDQKEIEWKRQEIQAKK